MIGFRSLALALIGATAVNAAPIVFQSSERQTSLLELYTSEGCSSCPPADVWLSRLKDATGLWTDFVPVEFHVDYWNSLGWKDPWSDERYSDRQRAYAQVWGADNIYTPEFVLNGNEWHRGFFQKSVPPSSVSNAGLLKVTSDNAARWQVTYNPPSTQEHIFEAHAALLVSGVSSDVTAGENARRHLSHDFAAIAFTETPLVGRGNVLKSTFVLDTTKNKPGDRLALAIWITPSGKTSVLQAIGGWLTIPVKQ